MSKQEQAVFNRKYNCAIIERLYEKLDKEYDYHMEDTYNPVYLQELRQLYKEFERVDSTFASEMLTTENFKIIVMGGRITDIMYKGKVYIKA